MATDPIPTSPSTPPFTPTAGELLKQGRLRQRLTLVECGKRTHIAPRYLEALEDNRWDDLPSESHRLGFLRSYARFLGVSSEEVIALYRHQSTIIEPASRPSPKPAPGPSAPGHGWFPQSWPAMAGLGMLLLVLSWMVYHQIIRLWPEEPALPMVRSRQRPDPEQARLKPPEQTPVQTNRIKITAEADSWLRVVQGGRMLYEGTLPARSTKEWSGNDPFQIKIGNVRVVRLFWNDQPVDVETGSRSGIKDLRLPPP